ncbi:transposase [Runella sp.]|uniref:transposase n=1 Tax=Runella sp. TaxID=1960881 RepID=UPI0038F7B20A
MTILNEYASTKSLKDWPIGSDRRCGKTSTGWFYGIKIHLIINRVGGPKLRCSYSNLLYNGQLIGH